MGNSTNIAHKYRQLLKPGPASLKEDYVRKATARVQEMCVSYVDHGSSRVVFGISSEWVLKAPRNFRGRSENKIERRRFSENYLPFPMAPCRLVEPDLLMMRKVRIDENMEFPAWAEEVDDTQVGKLEGHFVAYDYANRVPHD